MKISTAWVLCLFMGALDWWIGANSQAWFAAAFVIGALGKP